ncbi:hemerythrin HHE cation binding domain-containing protein [Caballeronia hypogeia]|uniref:Hemerythrin HHE cation binding domain-containing protein n=1 Tax=Caballeronia hypogeia TaxID=1777140 RepID=A0A158DAE7_9BURK|nr:hemerythrin domain-containing protein [Caballeronia hypogeia]SAK91461.1 hemerythrin HHE cation binding domain-containing protein [Caballeronia hypogeia]
MNATTEHVAIRIIGLDHQRLAAVTTTMQGFVRALGVGGPAPGPIVLRAMLYYIREYPEQFHHPLEDRYLFAALRRRTDHLDDVLDQLHGEHMEGDARLRNLEQSLTRFELKGEAALPGLRTLMDQYVGFCANHRRVEETVILPVAGRLLSESDWAQMDAACSDHLDPFGAASSEGESFESLYRLIVNAAPEVHDATL